MPEPAMPEPATPVPGRQFRWRGDLYDVPDRVMVPEVAIYERQARTGLRQMTETEQTMVTFLVALRRAGIVFTWAQAMAELPLEEFEEVQPPPADPDVLAGDDDDQSEAVDPPAAGAAAPAPEVAPAPEPAPSTTCEPVTG